MESKAAIGGTAVNASTQEFPPFYTYPFGYLVNVTVGLGANHPFSYKFSINYQYWLNISSTGVCSALTWEKTELKGNIYNETFWLAHPFTTSHSAQIVYPDVMTNVSYYAWSTCGNYYYSSSGVFYVNFTGPASQTYLYGVDGYLDLQTFVQVFNADTTADATLQATAIMQSVSWL